MRFFCACNLANTLWPGVLGNKIPAREIPRAVLVAVSTLLATLNGLIVTSKLLQGINMKIHHLKVRDTYYDYQLKMRYRPPSVPIIYLKGYWLNEIGFEIGKHIQVLPGKNHLVLTIDSDTTS
jgi:hypothetical protein